MYVGLNKMTVCQKPAGVNKCLFRSFVRSFLTGSVTSNYLLIYILDALMQMQYLLLVFFGTSFLFNDCENSCFRLRVLESDNPLAPADCFLTVPPFRAVDIFSF